MDGGDDRQCSAGDERAVKGIVQLSISVSDVTHRAGIDRGLLLMDHDWLFKVNNVIVVLLAIGMVLMLWTIIMKAACKIVPI